MEHDRKTRDALLDLFQDVETQRRRNQNAVGVLGALLGLELVGAVRGADGDGERIHAGLLDEIHDLVGLGVDGLGGLNVVLDARQHAELAFDGHVVLVGVLDDFPGQFDVFVVGMGRAVDHDRGETGLDAGYAQFIGVAVVEVQRDGDVAAHFPGHFDRALAHVAQHGLVGVLARAARHLDDHRRLRLDAAGDDGLELFHVVEIVGRNGIAAGDCLS